VGRAVGRADQPGHRPATTRTAAAGPAAPCRRTRVFSPRWHPHNRPLRLAALP
jgi:hypothetical protein